jgi:hypothetical protein
VAQLLLITKGLLFNHFLIQFNEKQNLTDLAGNSDLLLAICYQITGCLSCQGKQQQSLSCRSE